MNWEYNEVQEKVKDQATWKEKKKCQHIHLPLFISIKWKKDELMGQTEKQKEKRRI